MRCACGALLAGVDLRKRSVPASRPAASPAAAVAEATVTCPYQDCGQPNPPGSETCLYCNRPLAGSAAERTLSESRSLLDLPSALKNAYRIVKPLPTKGAEAELLLVEPRAGGPVRVAKVYRHGIRPSHAVQERIARIDPRHRVEVLQSGTSDGYAYELMEFCALGSLREHMTGEALTDDALGATVRELAAAIAGVHAAGLVHRDLKPENVLLRSEDPLDLVLTDFGIASVLDATQRFTGVARSLPYAPPESLSGVIDGKADYWALGMIVLELAQGRHPFADLSDAVILHHLTTRSIDLTGIHDTNLRKLLRGLLLRDPDARWGEAQLSRWLAGDATLAEPLEHGVGADFGEPYRIGSDVCHTPEQLAVALSRHWQDGIADLANSQLLRWFREVQKDQNVVRVLLDLQRQTGMHVDVRLLKLILHLAPGIPAVWRGESIELPAILARANLALKGDADAAYWLHALYQHRVLETYAQAGNAQAAEIVQRWNTAADRFSAAWKERLGLLKAKADARDPKEGVDFDALVYGLNPSPPSLATLHPRLLAVAYDPAWTERLRQALVGELAPLIARCPGLAELGNPLSIDGASLLVLESLLPEAKQAVERHIKADARRREAEAEECRAKKIELAALVSDLRRTAYVFFPTTDVCTELRAGLDHYLSLVAEIRASGRSDESWLELRRNVTRMEPVAKRMGMLSDDLSESLAINSGWLSWPTLGLFVFALVLLPRFLGPRFILPMVAIAVGIVAWRLLPSFLRMREIQELADKL